MTIKEVSERYQVSEATLRYYEKEGIIIGVKRKNGIRDYTEENFPNIEFVLCMRNAGMSMERLKKYIKLLNVPNSENLRKDILKHQRDEIKEQVEELTKALKKLDYKIEKYEKIIS